MTTTASTDATGAPRDLGVLDVSGTPRVPFTRLVAVEVRKMYDTRAGLWLLVAIAVITAAVVTLIYFNTPQDVRTFGLFVAGTATPQGFLVPVLGILLVTSEWTQRTTLGTFTLEPSRLRVVAAKVVAALLFGLAAYAVAVALGALAASVGGATDPFSGFTLSQFLIFAGVQVQGVLQGLAFGLLLLASAPAIVLYFVLPLASSIVFGLVPSLRDAGPWLDLGTAMTPVFAGGTGITGEQWTQIAVTTAIWVLLPFVLGVLRVARSEVK